MQNIMLKVEDEDKERAKQLAAEYGVTLSELIRFALAHVAITRPPMRREVTIRPKAPATPRNGAEGAP